MFNASEAAAIYRIKMTAKEYWLNILSTHNDFAALKPETIVIAGGCFTSLLHNEHPKDIDIFVLDDLEAVSAARHLLDDSGHTDNDPHYDKSASKINENIVNVCNQKVGNLRHQWIFTRYKTRQELINHFDFAHTKVSYDPIADKLYLSLDTYRAIMNKHLIKNGNNIVASWRFDKFTKKGWKIPDRIVVA